MIMRDSLPEQPDDGLKLGPNQLVRGVRCRRLTGPTSGTQHCHVCQGARGSISMALSSLRRSSLREGLPSRHSPLYRAVLSTKTFSPRRSSLHEVDLSAETISPQRPSLHEAVPSSESFSSEKSFLHGAVFSAEPVAPQR